MQKLTESTIGSTKLRNSYQLARQKISAIVTVAHAFLVDLDIFRGRITLSRQRVQSYLRCKIAIVPYLALAAAFCWSI
jgi:hypothetical protein